jgi:hypothetical protein
MYRWVRVGIVVLCTSVFCGGTFPALAVAQGDAPVISNVQVEEVKESSITITWETDEEADSLINYGLQPNYGIVRLPEANRTEHSVTLDELEPGRTYYFRVVSADENGNQGISADYQVQTSGEPQTGESDGQGEASETSEDTPTVEEISEQIEQIQDPQQLQEVLDTVVQAIQGVTDELTIVGPPTVEVEATTATVSWNTDRPASSEVLFSPSEGFSGDNFQFSQSSTGGPTQEHQVELIGLEPFTEYTFRVESTDELDITGVSENFTFRTKAERPEIRNLRIVKVEENAATLAWDTTAPAEALVEYQNLSTGEQNSVGRPTLATSHQMRLADLTFGTRYVAFVVSENSSGDRVRSQPIQFITVRDTAAPIISNVTNESTIFPGSESRIQTIVEWETDEPSTCSMIYQEGVAGATDEVVLEPDELEYNTGHVQVITEFAPATVYQFYLECTDESENTARSEDFVLFTPIQEKSIIDLIIENFEATFGWVQNITN